MLKGLALGKSTLGCATMIKRPRNLYVPNVESWGIRKPIGIVQVALQNATIVKNWGIGNLFAALLLPQGKPVAAQLPDPKGLSKPKLIKPRGPFVWAPVFQAVEMRRLLQ